MGLERQLSTSLELIQSKINELVDASNELNEAPPSHTHVIADITDLNTVKLDDWATPDDNADLDFSTSKHGLCPKAPNDTSKYLRGDATWAILDLSSYVKTQNRVATELVVSDTSNETDIYNYTIPAGLLGTTKMVRLTLGGKYKNQSGAAYAITIRVYFGSTKIYDDVSSTHVSSANERCFFLDLWLANQNANNVQKMNGYLSMSDPAGTTAGLGDIADSSISWQSNIRGEAAEDSSADKILKVTIQHGIANANTIFTRDYALLELL